MINFEAAKKHIIEKLNHELNPDLKYHNIKHTLEVLNAATFYAKKEGVSEPDMLLIQTAALYHDSGLLIKYKDHEEISCLIAEEVLPTYGYCKNQIKTINRMILSTRIPQEPHSLLDKILCDSDLDYVGKDDFFMNAMRLKQEWMDYGIITTLKEWYIIQVDFLEKHKYFTNSAIKLRHEKKMLNLTEIKDLLAL